MPFRPINHNMDREAGVDRGTVPAHRTSTDRDVATKPVAGVRTADARGSRHALVVLSLIGMLNTMDRVTVAAVLQPIKQEMRLSDAQLGLLSGFAFALLYAAMTVPLARLADRANRVRLLSACLAVWSLMTAATGLARGFPHLLLVRAGVGIGEAGCVPAAHSLIGDLLAPHRRAWGISVYNAGALAGVSLGLLATGVLAQHFGWRTALSIVGLSGLPLSLLALWTIPEPRRGRARPARSGESAWTAIRALLRRPALVHLTLGLAIGGCANFGIAQWLPSFYQRSFGASLAHTGVALRLVTGAGGILGTLCGGAAATRLVPADPRWELWLPAHAYGGAAPLYALVFLGPTMVSAIVCNLAAVFVGSLGIGVALSAIQSFAEETRRATAVSLAVVASSLLGLGLGPFLIGLASDALGRIAGPESLRYAMLGSILFLAWSAAHFCRAARHAVATSLDDPAAARR
jgi:predicted MFS family arabinose efflux permease